MKILTYNIHKGMDKNNKNTLEQILSYLKNIDADIICLQEVLGSIHEEILSNLKLYGYFLSNVSLKDDEYGISVYCKKSIGLVQGTHLTSKKERRGFIHLQLFFNDKLINIINLHLGLDINERRQQVEEVLDYTNKLRGKIIICGDFNQINLHINNYYDMAKLFDCENVETFKKSKSRIDYIFISQNICPKKYKVHFINLSDHYPVAGEFNI
jgi:endonuclease/exonuclease/phosphatase family metal-dependent hydrolase